MKTAFVRQTHVLVEGKAQNLSPGSSHSSCPGSEEMPSSLQCSFTEARLRHRGRKIFSFFIHNTYSR